MTPGGNQRDFPPEDGAGEAAQRRGFRRRRPKASQFPGADRASFPSPVAQRGRLAGSRRPSVFVQHEKISRRGARPPRSLYSSVAVSATRTPEHTFERAPCGLPGAPAAGASRPGCRDQGAEESVARPPWPPQGRRARCGVKQRPSGRGLLAVSLPLSVRQGAQLPPAQPLCSLVHIAHQQQRRAAHTRAGCRRQSGSAADEPVSLLLLLGRGLCCGAGGVDACGGFGCRVRSRRFHWFSSSAQTC